MQQGRTCSGQRKHGQSGGGRLACLGDPTADGARDAHHTQGLSLELHGKGLPDVFPSRKCRLPLRNPLRQVQHVQQGDLGRGLRVHPWCVANGDTPLRGSLQIHVGDPRGGLRDQLAPFGGLDDLPAHLASRWNQDVGIRYLGGASMGSS